MLLDLLGNIWNIAQVVLLFGFVIMIHELGHFVFAKLFGVKVETFNIGFGSKRLFSKKIGETEYTIRPWPLGGFVQLHGAFTPEEMEALDGPAEDKEEGDDEDQAEEKEKSLSEAAYDDVHALRGKPYYVKLLVFCGGVGFNFLSVIAVCTIWYMIGRVVLAPLPAKVDIIKEDSPYHAVGFRSFDTITSLGGAPTPNWGDVADQLVLRKESAPDQASTITLSRDSAATITLTVPAALMTLDTFTSVGVYHEARVGDVAFDTPADNAGLTSGDLIVAINGTPIRSWGEMTSIVQQSAEKPLSFELERAGKRFSTEITPMTQPLNGRLVGVIGITSHGEETIIRIANPFKAVALGSQEAWGRLKAQVNGLVSIFGSGDAKVVGKSLSGPVGILRMARSSAEKGFAHLINFFCLLSIALVIFNILPIPLLDGGHILQATIEAVIRRAIPVKALMLVYNAALIFLLGFVLIVSGNDFFKMGSRWFGGDKKPAPVEVVGPAGATTGTVVLEATE